MQTVLNKEANGLARSRPTKGNAEWFRKYLAGFLAKTTHDVPDNLREQVFEQARLLQGALLPLSNLDLLKRFDEPAHKLVLPDDNSAYMKHEGNWQDIVAEHMASNFGKYGMDTVSSVQEAVTYSYTLADIFNTKQIFFRGEPRYGNSLRSRVERKMGAYPSGHGPGLTDEEIQGLRRFQWEVERDEFLKSEIQGNSNGLPHPNDPIWLPIAQHYDESFGTRLLDISSSIYTGLYFACVDWKGIVDTNVDGILYLFLRGGGGGGLIARGYYFDKKTEEFDDSFDEMAPSDLTQSFRDWRHPEYFRIYKSSSASPREIAHDGWFLVRGDLEQEPHFGQGFKFRIPAEAKIRIAKQLWMTGYTPERMVRGPNGLNARQALRDYLSI